MYGPTRLEKGSNMATRSQDNPKNETSFSRWLLTQSSRSDAIGALAVAAKADNKFPANGDYEAISKRLNQQGADIEMHEALDDAISEWRSQ